MPTILGLDLETTGLDHEKDEVTELAWIIKEVGEPRPLKMETHFIAPPVGAKMEGYLSPLIQTLTKIKPKHVAAGRDLDVAVGFLVDDLIQYKVDFIVAHNGENFDRPFLKAKLKQRGETLAMEELDRRTWVDTSADCIYPEDCRQTNLMYLCAYHGFVNSFPHAALFDTAAMLRVLDGQDFATVAERAKSPWVFVKALTSYDEREKAKARRFNWEKFGERTFPKAWIKRVKECDFEKEKAECRAAGFDVVLVVA